MESDIANNAVSLDNISTEQEVLRRIEEHYKNRHSSGNITLAYQEFHIDMIFHCYHKN